MKREVAKTTIVKLKDGSSGLLLSLDTYNAVCSLLRSNPRSEPLIKELERATSKSEIGTVIRIGDDRPFARALAGAIQDQLPKKGRGSALRQRMTECVRLLQDVDQENSNGSSTVVTPPNPIAIFAWDCPCGERNDPRRVRCWACKGTIADGKIVPAITADSATVVRRGPSAHRPSRRVVAPASAVHQAPSVIRPNQVVAPASSVVPFHSTLPAPSGTPPIVKWFVWPSLIISAGMIGFVILKYSLPYLGLVAFFILAGVARETTPPRRRRYRRHRS
ncbi:MAG: hypothetical protein M3Y56_11265 [Armatimonadota bacterium]|nr:hypothetical protein [Armatimonadota bacterium]